MKFNEYIPQGGWMKANARKVTEARHEAIANIIVPPAIVVGLVGAYWLMAILELGC